MKVLNDLRFRYTWIAGDTGSELDINDLEIAFTLNLPNFLHSGQPIHVSPGFAFHWWQGPSAPVSTTTELPKGAFSAYVEFDWRTNPQNQFGVEADVFVGIYSDFENFNKSLRIHGTGLGWWRLTNNFAIKGGIAYLNRVNVKMLPAAGVFWQPNELWNLELYFPSPRVERYLWMLRNTHLWGYWGGEYGGGSWSIQHDSRDRTNDRIDINDIRLIAGVKWHRDPNAGVRGFAEIGWVFYREILFLSNPNLNLDLDNSIMLRGGLTF
ncbi:MAG: hypothetical protein IH991_15620 [Planctomycetes bacterium]|nr:hypothetical protein [Planctomycetota bacterium]